ncbi:hypothetical protein AVEN_246762-1 [Araneus ventricosus]|uniref:Uncharacterized protein n=1 Tax=Araneus ventricosus TaxID=182803 RepID=A0A4Y2QYL1_ARAVE|nr:hypothetical protein AVEN_246762-1 [Araneus ventricosus]
MSQCKFGNYWILLPNTIHNGPMWHYSLKIDFKVWSHDTFNESPSFGWDFALSLSWTQTCCRVYLKIFMVHKWATTHRFRTTGLDHSVFTTDTAVKSTSKTYFMNPDLVWGNEVYRKLCNGLDHSVLDSAVKSPLKHWRNPGFGSVGVK